MPSNPSSAETPRTVCLCGHDEVYHEAYDGATVCSGGDDESLCECVMFRGSVDAPPTLGAIVTLLTKAAEFHAGRAQTMRLADKTFPGADGYLRDALQHDEGERALRCLAAHLPGLLADRERREIQDEALQKYNEERHELLAKQINGTLLESERPRLEWLRQLIRDVWPGALPSDFARLLEIKRRGEARRAETDAMLAELESSAARASLTEPQT
jgi:hypothetical protein